MSRIALLAAICLLSDGEEDPACGLGYGGY